MVGSVGGAAVSISFPAAANPRRRTAPKTTPRKKNMDSDRGHKIVETVKITDGPDKPALRWGLAYPDKEQMNFRSPENSYDVRLSRIEEQADPFTVEIEGTVTSGVYKGHACRGVYDIGSRSGTLKIFS